jgi:hypothetical protein
MTLEVSPFSYLLLLQYKYISRQKLLFTMPYVTLTGMLTELRKEGYVEDLNLQQSALTYLNDQSKVFPEDLKIDKVFRFEGDSNPSDSSILYAISSDSNQLKGVLVNAFGIYSEPQTDELVRKLKIKNQAAKRNNNLH